MIFILLLVPRVGWVELIKIMGSVLKCTEFCQCRRGNGVFTFGNGGIFVFDGFEFCFNSVEFTGCLC